MKTKIKATIFDWSIILAVIPFLGYSMAYVYEAGYLSFFNLPFFIISLSIENVILTTFLLFAVIFGYLSIVSEFVLFPIVFPGITQKENPLRYSFCMVLSVYFLMFLPAYLLSIKNSIGDIVILSIGTIASLSIYYFLFPLLLYKKKKVSYHEKVAKMTEYDDRIITFMDLLLSKYLFKYTVTFITIVFCLIISYGVGQKRASLQDEYFIVKKNNRSYALVQMYRGNIIAVELYLKNKEIGNTFIVADNSSNFTLQKTGSLVRKK